MSCKNKLYFLWESEFDNLIFKTDKKQDIKTNQLKLVVYGIYKYKMKV